MSKVGLINKKKFQPLTIFIPVVELDNKLISKLFLIFFFLSCISKTTLQYVLKDNPKTVLIIDSLKKEFVLKNYNGKKKSSGKYTTNMDTLYLCVDGNSDARYLTNIYTVKTVLNKKDVFFVVLNSYAGCSK